MLSTMQDAPLLVSGILRHGQQVYGDSRVLTITGADGEASVATFAEVAERSERLARALARLGIGDSDRVGTFLWNNQTHQEAYLAIPGMGAVLHTLNLRLFPEQLAYVINHAEDQVVIVDASLVPLLARVRDQLTTVKHFVVVGETDASALGETLDYEELLAAESARLRLARIRRTPGRRHVLHLGHHRQPQGRGLQPPVDLPPLVRGDLGLDPGGQRAGQRALHRPHVPCQRLGHAVRRLHDRRRSDHAPDVPAGRAPRRHYRPAPSRPCRPGCPPSGTTSCATPAATRWTCRPCA